jgi:hypothetical protein
MARWTTAIRTLKADGWSSQLASGYFRVYSGTRPTDANTALSGNTLLFEGRFNATAFPGASSGVLTANSMTGGTIASTGTASFVRCLKSDGTTAVVDLSVGVGSGEAQFSTLSFVSGVTVTLSSLTVTEPVGT